MADSASRAMKDALIAKVNADNNLNLTFEQVTFDLPVLLDAAVLDLTDPVLRNTSVRFTTGGPAGSQIEAILKYNRLSVAKLFELYSKVLPENTEIASVHGFLPVIGERLGVTLDAEDFQNLPIEGDAGSRTLTLTAREDSYCYIGQQVLSLA